MKIIDVDKFIEFVSTLEGKALETMGGKSVFKASVKGKNFLYIVSTGKKRPQPITSIRKHISFFNKTNSLKFSDYSKQTVSASYLLKLFQLYLENAPKSIGIETLSELVLSMDQEALGDILSNLSNLPELDSTAREAIVKSRVGQGLFRNQLIDLWGCCSVTGVNDVSLLRASHIKPWRDSTNTERLCVYNGLLLVPNLDTLFDKGLISFQNDGAIIISNKLSEHDMALLGISEDLRISSVYDQMRDFLYHHRELIFEK